MRSPAEVIVPLVILALLLILMLWSGYRILKLRTRRAERVVERWAEQNGFHIEHLEVRYFDWKHFFPQSNVQLVFRVGVRDREKQISTGWLLVGHFLFGQLVDRVKVCWDKAPTSFPRTTSPAPKPAPMWDHEIDAAGEQGWNA